MARKPRRSVVERLALPFAAKDTPRDQRARKASYRRDQQDKEYLSWIHQFPCVVGRECQGPLEVHHEPPKSHAGAWHDRKTVPLCKRHHDRAVPGSRHALGYAGFCARWGVDLRERIEHYNRLYSPPF